MISDLPFTPLPPASSDPDDLVCVVDDDESVRNCLERLLRSARFPVECFASGADYLSRKDHAGPVCLIIDMSMPGLDGFDLQRALTGRCEQIIFLTGHGDVPMCARAMKAGAVDFLTKPVDDEILLTAVRTALERGRALGRTNAEQAAARRMIASLTPRELDVMHRVADGMLNKQIAAELGISEKTVKIHRGRMMRKTRSASVPALMRLLGKSGASADSNHHHAEP
ncbi:MAG: response regulator [Luteolibacter sp.]|jgi:FixJ family two-component response regulator|nr:response regulator [Luteolibacter sp.]